MNNVINRFFLWIILLPIRLYGKMGINTSQLKAILVTKLTMDDRRPNTFRQVNQAKKKPINLATVFTMVMSALLGCFFLLALAMEVSYTVRLTLYFSMYIFMLASTLISDFTSVLIDVRDNYIILPKPVNDRTVVMARLLHIIIHVCKLVLPMTLPGIIFMAVAKGIAACLLFFVLVIFASLLTIFLINALYIFILKVTTPQKFQNIISTFQIVFAVAIYASYQVVPRMMDRIHLESYKFSETGNWVWLVPSFWFGKAWSTVMAMHFRLSGIAALLLAVFIPLLSIYVVIKFFAPSFNRKLSQINAGNVETSTTAPTLAGPNATAVVKRRRRSLASTVSTWICKVGAEQMAFLLSWKMTSRSRDFKMKVYPSIGYMIVIFGMSFYQSATKGGVASIFSNESGDRLLVVLTMVIYFSSFVMLTALGGLRYSDKYKAAWIYFSAPVQYPGQVIAGSFKAILVKFYIPIIIGIIITGLVLIGPSALPNMLLAAFNQLFVCYSTVYLTMRSLPFSMQQSTNAKGGTFIKAMFALLLPVGIALLHFFIHKFLIVVCIFALMSVALTWMMQDSLRKLSWDKIKVAADEG